MKRALCVVKSCRRPECDGARLPTPRAVVVPLRPTRHDDENEAA